MRQIEARAVQRLGENDGKIATKPAGPAKRIRAPEACLPRKALQAWTLLQLQRQPGYGYDLLRRLDWPASHGTPARLYRLLRDLEQDGLVRSGWADSADGPDRRIYKLTSKGARQLTRDAQSLQQLLEIPQGFFAAYAQACGDLDS